MCSYRKQPFCLYLIEPIRFLSAGSEERDPTGSKWAERNNGKHARCPLVGKSESSPDGQKEHMY